MKQFSKIRPTKEKELGDEILFNNDHFSIVKYEDWSVLKTNDSIICIPILIETNQIVLRYEYIPTFKYASGQEYHLTIVAGTIEKGEDPKTCLLRELEEEAGIVLREDYVIEDEMKPLYSSKSTTNKIYPFILPLNERDYHEVIAKGDGSKSESLSKSVKVDIKQIGNLNTSDIITEYMLLKLKEYLNVQKY
jgi:8-oxo-dGTP pyrophosphatase MutT (NUDIX family)